MDIFVRNQSFGGSYQYMNCRIRYPRQGELVFVAFGETPRQYLGRRCCYIDRAGYIFTFPDVYLFVDCNHTNIPSQMSVHSES